MQATSDVDESQDRTKIFDQLSQEDEDFRRKILDLHRKLSDVDEDSVQAASPDRMNDKRVTLLDGAKIIIPSMRTPFSGCSSEEGEPTYRILERRRLRRMDLEHERRKHFEALRSRSERIDEVSEEDADEPVSTSPQETTFLNRLRIRRRSMKLLSFLSGKSRDKTQEERASKFLKIYMADCGKGPNTISIHHTSRDRRFWKLRSKRRASSSEGE